MMSKKTVAKKTLDGNEAVASVAYRSNEVIAIYPITPASPMGEWSDAWAAVDQENIWGHIPEVVEMQSEGGAAGAVHGALQAGSLATSFTASQGLLLMIPNMYKIAGELTPFTLHVAARTVATHALSIFGDHSDVMAARQTGFAMLAAGSVQEAHDFALISQAATLESRIPFLHFFDGFRTSHEYQKIDFLSNDHLRSMLDDEHVEAHRRRALTPDRPVIRGTAQNPDTFFQAREACNRFYQACPDIVQRVMDRFAALTGRSYHLFDYYGDPAAERVLIMMGSSGETARETVDHLTALGERVGVLRVRLFRPFSISALAGAIPASVRRIAVLDRTKEPGAPGDPLYLDIKAALSEAAELELGAWSQDLRIVAGRYGLSSKELTPDLVETVFEELKESHPQHHFTVGIVDDVTHLSLPMRTAQKPAHPDRYSAIFFGLGSDGTVSANKNTIKIIGEQTDKHVQGYFVYDSRKAGATTVSHLRFGDHPIHSAYLIQHADFVACHQYQFVDQLDLLSTARPKSTFLLNCPYSKATIWDHLPREVQDEIVDKQLKFYVIDAYEVARKTGMGGRINTIMQACFFSISQVLPWDETVGYLRQAIRSTYGKRGAALIDSNLKAVDEAIEHLGKVETPDRATATRWRPPAVSDEAPEFVQKTTALMLAGKGDLLPVSAFPPDGTWPVATSQWEKRNIALEIPLWDIDVCIQCNQCVLACPHAAIRAKVYDPAELSNAPEDFLSTAYRAADFLGFNYTIQVAPEDCTGCNLCVAICPAKDKGNPRHKAINMAPQHPVLDRERENYRFFLQLPEVDRARITRLDAKGSQFLRPLFEYSGACAGCGETPYIKLLTQLFGDRLLIANATGCSSIYGGNLPTTPYCMNSDGRGPAWSNSLFEDNAEFGLGLRLAVDSQTRQATNLLDQLGPQADRDLISEIIAADQFDEAGIAEQRRRVAALVEQLAQDSSPAAQRLGSLAEYLVSKSVWIVGGDGWAYDIGFGGLDHVLALNRNVNILVLDTEVYSNTGGQQSKATPLGATAKFATAGKDLPKKDLGLAAMNYGHVYVAQIAFGANMNQTVKTLREAETYSGTSLVIAYSPCIAHGYNLANGGEQQKRIVQSGIWPLYRFDPRRASEGLPALQLDSKSPNLRIEEFMQGESRFRTVKTMDPTKFEELLARQQSLVEDKFEFLSYLAEFGSPARSHDLLKTLPPLPTQGSEESTTSGSQGL
ncbi:MAG: pyruvate:ferredoxin (flavodoxin) oxidoreductase [Thermoanaerobaculia bacterium]